MVRFILWQSIITRMTLEISYNNDYSGLKSNNVSNKTYYVNLVYRGFICESQFLKIDITFFFFLRFIGIIYFVDYSNEYW